MQAKSLKFYTDTHIAKSIATQLRNHGVDVTRCEEVGLAKAHDLTHFEYAARLGYSVVTRDVDFLRHHADWQAQGKTHYGLFFVQDHLQGEKAIGVIVRTLLEYHELVAGGAATVETDITNQVIYVR
jgi:predicted nuclease of predicted toxin-antitoxin system